MNAPISPNMMKVARTSIETVPGQAPLYLECDIKLADGSLLGSETFRLVAFEGKEQISEHFEFNLTLHGNTDPYNDNLSFSRLIGRPVNLGVSLPDVPESQDKNIYLKPQGNEPRQVLSIFNGIVAGFGMQEPGVYQLVMRPRLWRMTLTNRYHVHRKMNLRGVLTALCRAHRIKADFNAISDKSNMAITRVQDWFQAGESDYEFMRRLLGKAHIFYYFSHQYGEHTLVFANRSSYPQIFKDDRRLRYTWTNEEELELHQWDVISQYSFQQSMGTSGVKGVFTTEEQAANMEKGIASYANFVADSPPDLGELPFRQYRIYQYGGSRNEVRHYTKATHDAIQTANTQLSGSSFCPLLRPGHQFRMKAMMDSKHPELTDPVRPELENAPFVITQISHSATLDGQYTNQFSAADAGGLVTPLSIADTQQGSVLAKVVAHHPLSGPGGWPYYTPDNFDMQEERLSDEQSSPVELQARGVYVSLSTDDNLKPADDKLKKCVWVKLMPSSQHVPEVGTMVTVGRANDESELPEIQAIHADGSMTVTPSDWTAHTQVGHAYNTSYGDGKSIRFSLQHWSAADTKVAANIVDTAYARSVGSGNSNPLFRDAGYSRGGSYSYNCSESMADGMLSESWSYGSGYGNAWAKENKNYSATGRTYHESVTGAYDPNSYQSTEEGDTEAAAAVQASKTWVIGKSYSKSTNDGDSKSISTFNGKVDSTTTHNGNVSSTTTYTGTMYSKATHQGTVTSEATHDAKVSSTNTYKSDLESTNTHTGAVTSTSTHQGTVTSTSTHHAKVTSTNTIYGDSQSTHEVTGTSTSKNTIGTSDNTSDISRSKDMTTVGNASTKHFSGRSDSVTITGGHAGVNITGATTSVDILGAGATLSLKVAVASIEITGPTINIPIILMVM
jgi:hypothetical protein